MIITQNGEARAVLQDVRSYEEMRNVIGLLKLVSQGEADVREGEHTAHDDLFERLEKELQRR